MAVVQEEGELHFDCFGEEVADKLGRWMPVQQRLIWRCNATTMVMATRLCVCVCGCVRVCTYVWVRVRAWVCWEVCVDRDLRTKGLARSLATLPYA
jgi:hypothetical protein